jgi:hypothetical protein
MLNRLSLAVITTLNLLTVYLVVVFEVHHLHDENHLFENLQVLLLCLSVVASSLLLRGGNPDVFVWAGLALLSFSFLLRELDLERLPLPEFLQAAGSGRGRAGLLGGLWLTLGTAFLLRQSDKRGFLLWFMQSQVFAWLALALLPLLGSAAMDKELLPFAHPRLLEELFEINAYAFMAWPALRRFRAFGQAPAADLA